MSTRPISNSEYADPTSAFFCPSCRSTNIEHSLDAIFGGDYITQPAECVDCGSKWDSIYTLTGYGSLETVKCTNETEGL